MLSNLFKKLKLVAISGLVSVMVASPAVKSEDIEIFFGQSKLANMVFALDVSGSMESRADVNSVDETIVRFKLNNQTTIANAASTYLFGFSSDPDVSKARFAQIFETDEDGNWTGFIRESYDQTSSYKLPAGDYVWVYYDDRISRLKIALYKFLTSAKTKDNNIIGMLSFGDGTTTRLAQTRRLDKVTAGKTHRQQLIDTVLALAPTGNTPTAEAYLEATDLVASAYTQIGPAAPNPILNGECGFSNAIVLLTDGIPTDYSSNTHSGITKITQQSCDASTRFSSGSAVNDDTNFGKECTTDLSTHYFNNDVKSNFAGSTINTTTVAFALGVPGEETPTQKLAKKFLEDTASTVKNRKLFYAPSDIDGLVRSFEETLNNIQDSTSFVAPSVPLSQSNRLRHSNNLYMAMFKPESNESWTGNLKKYSLKQGNIVDANGLLAVDTNTGIFLDSAESHWFVKDYSDPDNPILADGNEIDLGGALPKISIGETPKVYTNLSSNSLNQLTLDYTKKYVSNTNLATLGKLFGNAAISETEAQANFDWVRDRVKDSTNRFGDALHSRPQILEYKNKTVAFISTNQGYLHAVDTATGEELWSFFPRQMLTKVDKWKTNASFPDNSNISREYGLDGQIHIHSFVNSSGVQKHHLYVGMRRGGNNIYGLDISDESATPKMLYTVSDQFDLTLGELGYNSSGDTEKRVLIPNLAQSWSLPAVVKLPANNTGGYEKRLVFTGGFDTYYDDLTNAINPASGIKGNAIYSVPFYESTAAVPASITAKTLAGSADIKNSIASNLTFIDLNNDEVVDHIYAADVGGKIYRLDLEKTKTSVDLFVDIGTDLDSSYRFYVQPDVVFADYQGDSFAIVAIGSGLRSNPKNTKTIDKFYAFFDREIVGGAAVAAITPNDLFDVTTGATGTNGETNFYGLSDILNANEKGWYIRLAPGEKVLANSTTLDFNTFFTTLTPAQGSQCGVTAAGNRLYGVNLLDGSPSVRNFFTGTVSDVTDRYTNVNYVGIAPGVSIFFPDDTSIATLVGKQTICTGDNCDFFKGGVRTVKWREKK